MTPEQRIAQLEAELAEARADLRRVNETLRVMCETQARERAAEAERRAVRSARNVRARAKASAETSHETRTETSHETRTETSPALPPPLDGSPPLPAPISPSPLSSPPSVSSVGSKPPAEGKQATLVAVPLAAEAEKPRKRASVPNAVAEWFEAAKAQRAAKVPATAPDNSALRPDQWARLGEALKAHGQKALDAALAAFFLDGYARDRHFPLGLFVAQWEKYLSEANAKAANSTATTPRGSPDDERARALREAVAAKRAAGGGS